MVPLLLQTKHCFSLSAAPAAPPGAKDRRCKTDFARRDRRYEIRTHWTNRPSWCTV